MGFLILFLGSQQLELSASNSQARLLAEDNRTAVGYTEWLQTQRLQGYFLPKQTFRA